MNKPQRGAPLTAPLIHADRLFPTDIATRTIARRLYAEVRDLPIVSPHGHTDPRWYAENAAFPDPAKLFVIPDHYVFRMLYSQGVPLEEMGIARKDGGAVETDARKIWRKFAEHYHLFRGTPTRLWLDQSFCELFGMTVRLSAVTADQYFDRISECLAKPEFRPRALFEQFKIEVIATTESPLDPLAHHKAIAESGWNGRVVTAYRPDPVIDPDEEQVRPVCRRLGRDVEHVDARLESDQRFAHRLDHHRNGGGVVRSKNQIVYAAAEFRQHHALALGRAENEIDRFLDALFIARLRDLTARRDLQRKFPADAEEIALIAARLIHGVTSMCASA